jgi:hypothetical protein
VILQLLADGSITLTAVGLVASHLTPENHLEILGAARHKSKRDIEHLIARLHPQPAVSSGVRKLPGPKLEAALPAACCSSAGSQRSLPEPPIGLHHRSVQSGAAAPAVCHPPSRRSEVLPLAPERYKVHLTVDAETYNKLRRAQDLLRHSIPNGDPAAIFDRALTMLVAHLEKTKLASTDRPGHGRPVLPGSRHIPAAAKRAVWVRDEGRCAFVGAQGRCGERGFLEFHHVLPYADGGMATVENIQLRCRAHNAYEAEEHFGMRSPVRQAEKAEPPRSETG